MVYQSITLGQSRIIVPKTYDTNIIRCFSNKLIPENTAQYQRPSETGQTAGGSNNWNLRPALHCQ